VLKEGYLLGIPCLINRNEIERTELINIGFNYLVETKPELIFKRASIFLGKIVHSQISTRFMGMVI